MSDQAKVMRFIASPMGVVAVALLLRLAGLVAVDHWTEATARLFHYSGSAGEYPEVAYQIIKGHGFCFRVFDGQALPSAYLPPGYAYLLAGFFRVLGDGLRCFVSLQLLHVGLGTVICWLTYRLGELTVGRMAGLLAGYCSALYPASIFMSTQVHPAPIYILLNLLVVLLILRVEKQQWARRVVPAGILQGVLILFRPQTMVYAPLVGIWAGSRLKLRGRWLGPIVFLLLAGAVVAPWTIRNYKVFGRFIPVTNSPGFNLWRGQNDLPLMGESSDVVSRGIHPNLTGIRHDVHYETARDDIYKREALAYIREDPGRAMVNGLRKVGMFWSYNAYHKRGREPLVWGPWAVVGPFFLIGLIYAVIRNAVPWIFYAYLIVHTGLAAVFLCLPRYRMFIEPIIFIFAAAGVLLIYRRIRSKGAVA